MKKRKKNVFWVRSETPEKDVKKVGQHKIRLGLPRLFVATHSGTRFFWLTSQSILLGRFRGPNIVDMVNRKSKSIRFRECIGRGVQTISTREKRNASVKHGRAATYGPFTMDTCRRSSARQHRSTRAGDMHEDISTPGGRWASRGCGGASNDDVPGSYFKL